MNKFIKLKRKGFTIVELMISSLVLIIVVLGLASSMISFLKLSRQTNDMIIAQQIIKSVLENAKDSTARNANIINARPSNYISDMINEDKYFSVDIINEPVENNLPANRIIVVVSKGYRVNNNFTQKKFLSQSAKIISNDL